jgi:hypothetical protein
MVETLIERLILERTPSIMVDQPVDFKMYGETENKTCVWLETSQEAWR